MNCQNCGRHLNRMEIGKWQKDGHPLCSSCRKKELQEKVLKASPSQIKALKIREDDAPLIDEILKEHVTQEPQPERRPYTLPPKIEKCKAGEVYDAKLRKCVKIFEKSPKELQGVREQVHLPEPQVPARPVVAVAPITLEQRMDQLEGEIQQLKLELANLQGMLQALTKRR